VSATTRRPTRRTRRSTDERTDERTGERTDESRGGGSGGGSAAEGAAEGTAETKAGDRRPSATPLLALLATACLVMAVGCLALWHQNAHDHAVERAREDARGAAQSEAKDLLSYNFRTLDYDLSKARSEMTPGMARSFGDYWRIFRPSVEKSQTQALTQIEVTGVTDATPERVEVVLFVKMISVNAAHKEPQVDTSWPRLQLRKIGKRWLIDGPRMTTPPPNAAPAPATSAPPRARKSPGKAGRPTG
jgi:Mce-associated membrane protein